MSQGWKRSVCLWVYGVIMEDDDRRERFIKSTKKVVYGSLTCMFAVGGCIVGVIVGAMKGQTTETGFVRGAGIGAVAGAITALQLLESIADGESLSKVALLSSLMEGKVFMEWVCPAVLKAYQWQMMALDTTYRDISDLYDANESEKSLSKDCIQNLPACEFKSNELIQSEDKLRCSICLQDMKNGEIIRNLPNCAHLFHLGCIDEWLNRQDSCPMCRKNVCCDKI